MEPLTGDPTFATRRARLAPVFARQNWFCCFSCLAVSYSFCPRLMLRQMAVFPAQSSIPLWSRFPAFPADEALPQALLARSRGQNGRSGTSCGSAAAGRQLQAGSVWESGFQPVESKDSICRSINRAS